MKNSEVRINKSLISLPMSNGVFNIYNQNKSVINLQIVSQNYIFPEYEDYF